ncbi:flavodoxin family protein [Paenibacillus aquistagni]|uniref:Multimeric flavodoxin WrbA n=1 Tax=Paenibacillus aquistagni TaxID=1852522 RepID=A0A1X7LUI0_9BACL|nr:flavodoxin family protein [Paenibacillus aquistagni]SMG56809.1 Multimeric flavodoxin WrbA [Paenibacillus aquistagni]
MYIIQGSSRENGNTEQLTAILTKGIQVESVNLRDKKILQIVDGRHAESGFMPVEDDMASIVDAMLKHDTLVFATPLYWYGMSGHMKTFIDRWSQCLRDEALQFKERMQGKKVYVVIVGGPKAKMTGLPLVQQFQHICSFMGMSLEGWIIGRGSKPGDVLLDQETIAQAKEWNREWSEEAK